MFYLILFISLLSSLFLGIAVPRIALPEPEIFSLAADKVYPVQLLAPLPEPRPPPAENQSESLATLSSELSPPQSVPDRYRQAAVSEQGVLAMSDALARLQGRRLDTREPAPPVPSGGTVQPAPASGLSQDITRISQGVSIGVSVESLLGSAELPQQQSAPGGQSGNAVQGGQSVSMAVGQSRSERDIQTVLDRHKGEIYALYNRALRDSPELQGQILLRLEILPSGAVASCEVLEDRLGSPWLKRELVALVRGIDFGPRPGGGAIATLAPIEFFPQ